ncbi:MAG: site-specific DNA-methyltransferase [Thermoplasmata archaeon]|nr:site-specific DNA-methyltransferase [Thermoplasmata archaeon]
MEEESAKPYVAGEQPVSLSWKTRLKSGSAMERPDYGSFYAILPKGQVEELSWDVGERLTARIEDDALILRPARSPPPKVEEPSKPYPLDRIVRADVLDELRRVPGSSVHMVVTSPPYNVGIEYSDYDDKRQYSEYRAWLSEVWKECFRVLKRGGRLALEVAPTGIAEFVPLHHDLSRDIRAAKFTHRAEILWAKQNMSAPRTAWGSWKSPRHPHVIPSWEYVEVFHKQSWKLEGDPSTIDISPEEFRDWSDGVWEIPPDTRRVAGHPATFPEQLIRQLLLFFTYRGNTIMDPFGGTGTVAAVAKANGRHFIHIDQSEKYCHAAEDRVRKVQVIAQRPIRKRSKTPMTEPKESMLFIRNRAIPQT